MNDDAVLRPSTCCPPPGCAAAPTTAAPFSKGREAAVI